MTSAFEGAWWKPCTAVGPVAVVQLDLSPHAGNEREAWTWLDAAERDRADRFRDDAATRRFVLCRAVLRSLLCCLLPCRNERLAFDAAQHGKPIAVIDGCAIPAGFNVSHSGRRGLIALSRDLHAAVDVGVDVEERLPQRNLDVLVPAVLGPDERAEVMAATRTRRLDLFLGLWTKKEALAKAHGMGMSMDVSGFEIPRDMRHGARSTVVRLPEQPDTRWQLHDISTASFAAAVAFSH